MEEKDPRGVSWRTGRRLGLEESSGSSFGVPSIPQLGPPAIGALFLGGSVPLLNRLQKKGALILTSLLEDLDKQIPSTKSHLEEPSGLLKPSLQKHRVAQRVSVKDKNVPCKAVARSLASGNISTTVLGATKISFLAIVLLGLLERLPVSGRE